MLKESFLILSARLVFFPPSFSKVDLGSKINSNQKQDFLVLAIGLQHLWYVGFDQ